MEIRGVSYWNLNWDYLPGAFMTKLEAAIKAAELRRDRRKNRKPITSAQIIYIPNTKTVPKIRKRSKRTSLSC